MKRLVLIYLSRRKSQGFTPDRENQDTAATTIQRQWRKKQSVQRQIKFQEQTEQASIDIQSALRGHLTRKKMLNDHISSRHSLIPSPAHTITPSHSHEYASYISDDDSDGSESSVAVEKIQSALRGHVARQMALQDLVGSVTYSTCHANN